MSIHSRDEIEEAIHMSNVSEPMRREKLNALLYNEDEGDKYFYTMAGREDFRDTTNAPRVKEEKDALSCASFNDEGSTYYIRVGRDGIPYNPIEVAASHHHTEKRIGIASYVLVNVPQEIFKLYNSFLKNKVGRHYVAVNRFLAQNPSRPTGR